jgi:hypothetical protein
MTKEQLIEAIKDYPPDALVNVLCSPGNCRDPGGVFNIINIRIIEGRIVLEIDDE